MKIVIQKRNNDSKSFIFYIKKTTDAFPNIARTSGSVTLSIPGFGPTLKEILTFTGFA